MTEISSDQTHLDQDITGMQAAFQSVVDELKAQANTGQPLDFTKADALLASMQSEATADATAAPSQPSTPVDTSTGDTSAPASGDTGTPATPTA